MDKNAYTLKLVLVTKGTKGLISFNVHTREVAEGLAKLLSDGMDMCIAQHVAETHGGDAVAAAANPPEGQPLLLGIVVTDNKTDEVLSQWPEDMGATIVAMTEIVIDEQISRNAGKPNKPN